MKLDLLKKLRAISRSGLSIYDPVQDGDELFLGNDDLEAILDSTLRGLNLAYKLRTRSKVLKSSVCEALGYATPKSFKKTKPRFPCQDFDTYVQKSNNLQIWNEEINPTRRYVLVRVNRMDIVTRVRVVTGEAIAMYDKTGTLTSKFQARRKREAGGSLLASPSDTRNVVRLLKPVKKLSVRVLAGMSATSKPEPGKFLAIEALFGKLHTMLGSRIADPGFDQERKRGSGLERLASNALGLESYAENGQFPDILAQALEVKLQTSPTIDLGLVTPDSAAPARDLGSGLRHCDVRYAIIYADCEAPGSLRVKELVVTSGQDFFKHFDRFEGRVINKKLQIPIPSSLFGESE